jgi:hypothetical protein
MWNNGGNDLEGKVHSDGGAVVLGEELVDVALDDAGLPAAQLTWSSSSTLWATQGCSSFFESAV